MWLCEIKAFFCQSDPLLLLTPFMIVMSSFCVSIVSIHVFISISEFSSAFVCKVVTVLNVCVSVFVYASALHNADRQLGATAYTQSSPALFSGQVRYMHRSTSFYCIHHINTGASRSIGRAKWRRFLLYLFMKLLSRHQTRGSDCNDWVLT